MKIVLYSLMLRSHFFFIFFVVLFDSWSAFAIDKEPVIGIFTYQVKGVKPWDDDSVHSGITGSEEAVIYLSRSLARCGFQIVVFNDHPDHSPHAKPGRNPRYVKSFEDLDLHLDAAVSWRNPYIAEELKKKAAKVYFWPHDTPPAERIDDKYVNGFDDVFWLSEWQRAVWIKTNSNFAKFTHIFGNGIDTKQFRSLKPRKNLYSCVYGSNYGRGLELLLNIWPKVKDRFPQATLDIYYGWNHWGLLSEEKEKKLKKLIEQQRILGVREWGCVGHEELTRAYETCSIWTYPCISAETFCITALRAQFAGLYPVIIEGSALTETVRYGVKCSKREEYLDLLLTTMENIEQVSLNERQAMREFISKEYTWDVIAKKWKEVID